MQKSKHFSGMKYTDIEIENIFDCYKVKPNNSECESCEQNKCCFKEDLHLTVAVLLLLMYL